MATARAVIVACLLAAVAGCSGPPVRPLTDTTDTAAPAADEQALLRNADVLERRLLEDGYLYGNAELDAWLQSIVNRLLATRGDAAQELNPRIHTRTEILPLADALPNGALYVSAGLIARVDNEAQLAAILSRELSRYLGRADVKEERRQRADTLTRLFPNLLWITATAGLGALNVPDWDEKARASISEELEQEADDEGLAMLVAAGYAAESSWQAFQSLKDDLQAEQRLGLRRFTSGELLDKRREHLAAAVATRGDAPAVPARADPDRLAPWRRRFLLEIAGSDVAGGRLDAANALLDRRDALFGRDGPGALQRAELLERRARTPEDDARTLAALQAATGFADVPPTAFRELGFLQRRRGDKAAARVALAEYLKRQPEALDAPIVRGYLEEK